MVDRTNFYGVLTKAWRGKGEPVPDEYFRENYARSKAAMKQLMQSSNASPASLEPHLPLQGRYALIEVAKGYVDGFGGRFTAPKTAEKPGEILVSDLIAHLAVLEENRFGMGHVPSATDDMQLLRVCIACEVLSALFAPDTLLVAVNTGTGPEIGLALEAWHANEQSRL